MKSERQLLEEIFDDGKRWRGKYKIDWCELCQTAIIACNEKDCHGTTCNCGGCKVCCNDKDYQDFGNAKTTIGEYLSEEEKKIYSKCQFLQEFIIESLKENELEINWKRLKEQGELCMSAEEIFAKEIKESYDKQGNDVKFGPY